MDFFPNSDDNDGNFNNGESGGDETNDDATIIEDFNDSDSTINVSSDSSIEASGHDGSLESSSESFESLDNSMDVSTDNVSADPNLTEIWEI